MPSRLLAKTRWPELLTGRNSVRPWTNPIIIDCSKDKLNPPLKKIRV